MILRIVYSTHLDLDLGLEMSILVPTGYQKEFVMSCQGCVNFCAAKQTKVDMNELMNITAGYLWSHWGYVLLFSSVRTKTRCEAHRDSLLSVTEHSPRGPRPPVGQYIPTCDENGAYEPMQCHGSTGYCWCVDRNGQEISGTRSGPGSRPMCE